MCLDSGGAVYAAGETKSQDFPATPGAVKTTPGGQWDGFIAKFNADLSQLAAATLIGYAGHDLVYALRQDDQGNLLAAGETSSTNFPGHFWSVGTNRGGRI